jgi:hypothetical protein
MEVDFSVDPGMPPSMAQASGNIGGMDLLPQGAGSLVTNTYGTIVTFVDEVNGTLDFAATGNDLTAENSGTWQPGLGGGGGSAPANYGAQVSILGSTGYVAIRNLTAGADTGGSSLNLYQRPDGSYGFNSGQTLLIESGAADYSHPFIGHGSVDLSGNTAQNQADDGTFYDNGDGTYAIVVPVNVTVSGTIAGVNYTLNLAGTIYGFSGYAPGTAYHHLPRPDRALAISQSCGAHDTGRSLLAASLGNLDRSGYPEIWNVTIADLSATQSQDDTDTAPTGVTHPGQPSGLPVVDAAFLDLVNPEGITL